MTKDYNEEYREAGVAAVKSVLGAHNSTSLSVLVESLKGLVNRLESNSLLTNHIELNLRNIGPPMAGYTAISFKDLGLVEQVELLVTRLHEVTGYLEEATVNIDDNVGSLK